MAVPINVIIFLLHVELAEEVEGDDRVDVHYDGEQHHREDQLRREELVG